MCFFCFRSCFFFVFFFKQKTAYEMRISDWSSDVCSSDLDQGLMFGYACDETPDLMPAPIWYAHRLVQRQSELRKDGRLPWLRPDAKSQVTFRYIDGKPAEVDTVVLSTQHAPEIRSEEHTSELQSLMRISYAVFCLKK